MTQIPRTLLWKRTRDYPVGSCYSENVWDLLDILKKHHLPVQQFNIFPVTRARYKNDPETLSMLYGHIEITLDKSIIPVSENAVPSRAVELNLNDGSISVHTTFDQG